MDYTNIGGSDIVASEIKEEVVEKKKKATEKKQMPFVLGMLFNDIEGIQNMTALAKSQSFFLTNRKLAAKYPVEANMFNRMHINLADVIDFWSHQLYTGQRAPGWIYTKVDKEAKKGVDKSVSVSLMKAYCTYYGISMKDLEFALSLPGIKESMISDLKEFEKFKQELDNE